MRTARSGKWEAYLLPVALGLSDGILTALALVAGLIFRVQRPLTLVLVVRVAVAAVVTSAIVLFVGRYGELRHGLARAERHLNLLDRGHLAATRLGRDVFRDALKEALVAAICTFCGAAFPLVLALLFPGARWVAVVGAIVALSALGTVLAIAVRGRPLLWAVSMVLLGVAFTALGIWLNIV